MKALLGLTTALTTLLCYSCGQLKVSEKEIAAVKEINSLYGGTCSYTVSLNASTKYGKTRSFEIEISNSDFLNPAPNLTEMFLSNIPYVFFTFTKQEKQKYNNIQSSIVYRTAGKATLNYTWDTLELVDKKMVFVRQIISLLQHQDSAKISGILTPGIFPNEKVKSEYFTALKSADSIFGDIIYFTPTGFRFSTSPNGIKSLHISGNLKRSKRDSQFSIDVNPSPHRDELYSYGYDY